MKRNPWAITLQNDLVNIEKQKPWAIIFLQNIIDVREFLNDTWLSCEPYFLNGHVYLQGLGVLRKRESSKCCWSSYAFKKVHNVDHHLESSHHSAFFFLRDDRNNPVALTKECYITVCEQLLREGPWGSLWERTAVPVRWCSSIHS